MESLIFENKELGLCLHTWQGQKKPERVFLANEIMKQLGYSGTADTLRNYDLIEEEDFIKLTKMKSPDFFKYLFDLKSIGSKTSSLIMLYESGVWKLIMQSKKKVGIETRNWLAREVLPSIREKGYYDVSESEKNPVSYLNMFTERNKQIENSKNANTQIYNTDKDYIKYHNTVHKLVNGMTAKEIQLHFNSKKSARELLREYLPENAATEALIDELFTKYHKNLAQIAATNIHNAAKETFKALFSLGLNPKQLK